MYISIFNVHVHVNIPVPTGCRYILYLLRLKIFRKYVASPWCMQEFQTAHNEMVEGRKKFLVPILIEKLEISTLPCELQMYLRTHTYIDASDEMNDLDWLQKRIRFAMPGRWIVLYCFFYNGSTYESEYCYSSSCRIIVRNFCQILELTLQM